MYQSLLSLCIDYLKETPFNKLYGITNKPFYGDIAINMSRHKPNTAYLHLHKVKLLRFNGIFASRCDMSQDISLQNADQTLNCQTVHSNISIVHVSGHCLSAQTPAACS